MIAQEQPHRQIIKFPSLLEREGALEPGSRITLQTYYSQVLLPDIQDQSKRSLDEDRHALNRWTEYVGEPDIRDINANTLQRFRDAYLHSGNGKSPATVNKVWRELKAMLSAAADDGLIVSVPKIGRRSKSKLVKEPAIRQREIVTEAELERIWLECRHATYPTRTQHPAPKLWRVALVLLWTYGPRTLDVINLKASDIWTLGEQKILQFKALKTGKLQGLPVTPIVAEHLKSISGYSERLFPGFNSRGACLHKTTWTRGYYATWRNEICRSAQLDAPVLFKHFRQRVVTNYNGIEPGLGNWIAGHYVPGVSAQNYDLPTKRIRDAICSAPVPDCFKEIG